MPAIAQWLRSQRVHDQRPLHELLGTHVLDASSLMELVSIDLIDSIRRRRPVHVETYLSFFPEIAENPDYVMDLIDVEVCVRRECGEEVHVQELQQRFPALAGRLAKLADLDEMEQNLMSLVRSPHDAKPERVADDSSVALSLDASLLRASHENTLRLDGETLEPPEGVRVLQLVASRIGVQLYRAVHIEDRRPLALKVIRQSVADRMPAQAWLDRLELAAQINYPHLANAESVIANNHHFVVLRPWIEGTCWGTWSARNLSLQTLFQPLILLADMLQVLANAGMPHGHVHPGNLIVDHQQKLWLTDHGSGAPSTFQYPWIPFEQETQSVEPLRWLTRDRYAIGTLAIHVIERQRAEIQPQLKSLRKKIDQLRQPSEPAQVESISQLLREFLDGRSAFSTSRFWPLPGWRSSFRSGETS